MADSDAGLDHIADTTHRMATDMAKATKSAEGLSSFFMKAVGAVAGVEAIRHAVVNIVERSHMYQTLSQAISRENLSRVHLLGRELNLLNQKRNIEGTLRVTSGDVADLERVKLFRIESQLALLQKQKVVAHEMQKISSTSLVALGAYKLAAIDLYVKTAEFNQNLIEANSSFRHREKLMRETMVTQAQLGIGFDRITSAARALVHYGMDTATTYNTNLRLVAQMEQGLGVSVDHSAQLASIVERQVKGSFESVAHTIAQIVEDTALAGDEAARLATNISIALGRLRPGLSAAGLPDVLRLVGRYEGALKEVGGQSGAIQQLLAQLTTPEGMVGAGALGVSPEFLATSQGVKTVMDNFSRFGEQLVGQSQGWERQMRLQALAQMFNVSADQANQMLMAIKRANAQQDSQISLQDRWRNQLHATNAGIQRLGNSLWALLNGAMYPVVLAVGAVTNKLADFVEWMLKSKSVVYAVSGALFIGFVALTSRMWGLARALWAVVASSTAATAALARQSAVQGVSAATGLLPAAGFGATLSRWFGVVSGRMAVPGALSAVTTWSWLNNLPGSIAQALRAAPLSGAGMIVRPLMMLVRGVGLLLSPLGLLVAGVGALAYFAHKEYSEIKRLREQSEKVQQLVFGTEDLLKEQRMRNIYEAARYGSPVEKLTALVKARTDEVAAQAANAGITPEQLNERMAIAVEEIRNTVGQGVTTRAIATPLVKFTPAEDNLQHSLLEVTGKLHVTAEASKKVHIQALQELQETKRVEDTQRQVETINRSRAHY